MVYTRIFEIEVAAATIAVRCDVEIARAGKWRTTFPRWDMERISGSEMQDLGNGGPHFRGGKWRISQMVN